MIYEDSLVTFVLNEIGQKTGQSYIGTFKSKCLMSPLDEINADRLFRDLLGPKGVYEADSRIINLAMALSHLKYRLEAFPTWWSVGEVGGGHIPDDNVILSVMEHCLKYEAEYVKNQTKVMEAQKKKLVDQIKTNKIKKEEKVNPEDELLD